MKYTLTLPEGVFTDVAGQSSDSLSMNYTTLDPDKLGRVIATLSGGRDGVPYIVQLLNGGGKLLEERTGQKAGSKSVFE